MLSKLAQMSMQKEQASALVKKKMTIPLCEVELAQEEGWEVYAYSEYYWSEGRYIPKYAEIQK